MKRIVTSYYFPFVILGLIMLVLHFRLALEMGDDLYFKSVLSGNGSVGTWLGFIRQRYQTWSSRIVIETILIILTHATVLWRLLDALVMVWIGVAFSVFFNPEKRVGVNWFIVCAVLSYSFYTMGEAGWIATTLNYSWPLAFGLLAILPICNTLRKKRSSIPCLLLSLPALIYAANQEQMCAVMLAVCGFFLVYLYVRDKKVYRFVACEVILCLASLIFILTCPGNNIRYTSEIATWFPGFANLSFFTKLEMGYSSTLYHYIMETNLFFSLFCTVLLITVFLTTQNSACRVVSVIPLAASIIMGPFSSVFAEVLPNLTALKGFMTETGTGLQWTRTSYWIPDGLITCVLLCVLASIFLAFKDKKKAALAIYLLLVGLASRWVMGFSPTIWASGTRTFIFTYFSFITVSVMLFQDVTQGGARNVRGRYSKATGKRNR